MKAGLRSALAVLVGIAVAIATMHLGGREAGFVLMAIIVVALQFRPNQL